MEADLEISNNVILSNINVAFLTICGSRSRNIKQYVIFSTILHPDPFLKITCRKNCILVVDTVLGKEVLHKICTKMLKLRYLIN